MDDLRIERILRAVESIPAGQLATYGDIGKITGESPRVIGRVLATWGNGTPWWRVCNAQGEIPGHFQQALPHWLSEGIDINTAHTGVKLDRHRTDSQLLAENWAAAVRLLQEKEG